MLAANKKLCKNIFSKSTNRLLRDKLLAPPAPDNKWFAMGRKFEPIILSRLNFLSLVSEEVYTCSANDRLMASLDGRDEILECIVEIKTTLKEGEKLKQAIEYYRYQLAHQCYVCGYDYGYLAIGHVKEGVLADKITQIEVVAKDVIEYDDWFAICNETLVLLDSYTNGKTLL